MSDESLINPLTKYFNQDYPNQSQPEPGLESKLDPKLTLAKIPTKVPDN